MSMKVAAAAAARDISDDKPSSSRAFFQNPRNFGLTIKFACHRPFFSADEDAPVIAQLERKGRNISIPSKKKLFEDES